MTNAIRQTWSFDQPIQEVWEYLTKPELIAQWLMKNDFKPVVGHQFKFTFDAKPGSLYDGVVQCKVLEVRPPSRLVYSWNGGSQDGSRTFESTVEWTLTRKNSETELQIVHDGFVVLEDINNHTGGWNKCLERMKELLKQPVA